MAGSTYYQHCLGANGFTSSELRQTCKWYGHLGLASDVGKIILRYHCCDTASCHGSLSWILSEKNAKSGVLRRRIWGNLEEHPGPHPEVVVCPGSAFLASWYFTGFSEQPCRVFIQSYLLSIALRRKRKQKVRLCARRNFPTIVLGMHSTLCMSTWHTHFKQVIKFQLSLFWAFWIQRKYFILLCLVKEKVK